MRAFLHFARRLRVRKSGNLSEKSPKVSSLAAQYSRFRETLRGDLFLARLLARRPEGIFVPPFGQGEIGPDLFHAACNMGLEGLLSSAGIDRIGAAGRYIGSKSRTEAIWR